METGWRSHDRTSEKASLLSTGANDAGLSDRRAQTTSREQGVAVEAVEMQRVVRYNKLPWGIWLFENLGLCCFSKRSYKILILVLTYCCYSSYHLSRKPPSVVKIVLCPVCGNCSNSASSSYSGVEDYSNLGEDDNYHNYTVPPGWAPFNGDNGSTLLGIMDYSWLFAYAIAMFFSGALSDRLNLRYFLTVGMIGSGISVCLLGVAYFANIHKLYYFIVVQIFGGALQSTGWPSVVAVMSNWFGKQNRGLIMGVWNSHTSVGNILGTIIPSFWADCDGDNDAWGWAFLVPGFIIIFFGIVTYFFLVSDPEHVGLPSPVHHLQEDLDEVKSSVDVSQSLSLSDDRMCAKNTASTSLNNKPSLATTSHRANATAEESPKAINFLRALTIPGVVEYSLALFFNKLVSYTFLYWLPLYVKFTNPGLSGPESDWLSTFYDVGGIIGGILGGVVSDRLNARAITCVTMLILAVPSLFIFRSFGSESLWVYIVLLILNGLLINGPYGMITTAVSSDLGTHPSLKSSQNAKATVTAIIDGTGSLGAAVGPLLIGVITRNNQDWTPAFYMLMASCFTSALFMSRLVYTDIMKIFNRINASGKNYSSV